jgi:glycosyltransferase involved in cell wall biosynthesis
MRVGQNPAKQITTVAQPADVTVAVVNFIPFIGGFYEQSAEVLEYCLQSIWENTDQPFDLMVFDNHSCSPVRELLLGLYEKDKIQYLVFSEKNIGKIGAWNYMFGAAQGRYIAFADNDIYFQKDWLSASLELFEAFPNVGMVTGRPLRTPEVFSSRTMEWGKQQPPGVLEAGQFMDWETFWEHALSTGFELKKAQERFRDGQDYRLNYKDKQAYVGSAHFQFLTHKDVLQKIIPLPSKEPMRGERAFDIAVNQLGYLRLTTCEPFVRHIGNRLPGSAMQTKRAPKGKSLIRRLIWLPGIHHVLLWLHDQIFRLYFHNAE